MYAAGPSGGLGSLGSPTESSAAASYGGIVANGIDSLPLASGPLGGGTRVVVRGAHFGSSAASAEKTRVVCRFAGTAESSCQ